MSEKPIYCPHGKPILTTNSCRKCELVWYLDCLNDARRRVKSCTDKIAEIQALIIKDQP